ncbi:MAG: hypothetical protein ABIK81_03210 [candidate division WOR-3 bacterium]
MKHTQIFFLGVLIFLIAYPGVRMVIENEGLESKEKMTHTAYIEKDRMRADLKGKEGDMTIIFRSDKGLFWSIDHKDKSYTEITKDDLSKMKKKMTEGLKMMEEEMKNLPPEQRKKIEEMMKGKMKAESPKVLYKKVATNQKVNQWVCDKYEGYEGKERVEEVWTTDYKKLGLKSEELKVMEDMANFFSEITKDLTSRLYKVGKEETGGFSGIPVRTFGYEKGKKVFAMELKEIKKEEIKPVIFELPKGYKKEKFEIEE